MTTITLFDYIRTVMNEAGFNEPIGDVQRYVNKKAEEALKRQNGAIDNETVKAWILECRDGAQTSVTYGKNNKGAVTYKPFDVDEAKKKAVEQAGRPNDKKMGQDAYMESLF